jgi:hypothetical protein
MKKILYKIVAIPKTTNSNVVFEKNIPKSTLIKTPIKAVLPAANAEQKPMQFKTAFGVLTGTVFAVGGLVAGVVVGLTYGPALFGSLLGSVAGPIGMFAGAALGAVAAGAVGFFSGYAGAGIGGLIKKAFTKKH